MNNQILANNVKNVIPFDFKGHDVRVIGDSDSKPWFIAKDVTGLLGYLNSSKAIKDHCKSPQILKHNDSLGLEIPSRGLQIIPESDVYRLIIKSKLPEAEAFEEWVMETVLPSIRRTGSYGIREIDFSNEQQVAGLLAQSLQRVQEQQKKIEEDKPKVEFYDEFASKDGLYGLQNAGRALHQRPNKFVQYLKQEYLFYQGGNLMAKARYINQGLFEVKTTTVDDKVRPQTFITPKGLQYFADKLKVAAA